MNTVTAPRYVVGGRRSEQDHWPPTSHEVPASQIPPDLPVSEPFERRGYRTVVLDPYPAGSRRDSIRAPVRAPVRSIFIDERFREHHESPSLPRAATYGENSDHGN